MSATTLDRTESFPEQECRELDALGVPARYVPARFGGELRDFPDLVDLVRTLAGRDMTVAVAHVKTFLGAASVWLSGGETQARELGRAIIGGARVAWGLSEPEHGADLLAGELTAIRDGAGYRLRGVKWPINNATRGSHICLLARTDPGGGPRCFSLFLIDKATLTDYRTLPKVRTHGIRGVDISGIAFDGAWVPATALVGEPGDGIETVLRALQLTRTMCVGLSLGAGAHALRLATAFVAERIIQGKPLIARPTVRAVLARCTAALFTAEAVATFAARAAHVLPREMSVISAVVKALVPSLVDRMIGELGELLGARSFLDGVYADGAFQKIQRDHRIVGIFDGSTVVNRNALINQFPRLIRGHARQLGDPVGLALAARIDAPLPELDPAALTLLSPQGCGLTQQLAPMADRCGDPDLAAGARAVLATLADLHERMAAVRPAAHPATSAYRLAERYERAFAAAACLRLWDANRVPTDAWWHDDLWLHLCLRELTTHDPYTTPTWHRPDVTDRVVDALAAAVRDDDRITLFGGVR